MAGRQLSIVIVAYNALPYLDLTLRSVLQSTAHIDAEIIVVDNDSDEPVSDWVSSHFPEADLITCIENLGFGKANNLAVSKAKGEIILFLNPDTIISRQAIDGVLQAFDKDKQLGAAGLRMINGNGEFLAESKRAVPSLWSSFCRISGLSALFPKSRLFSYYRMGHISEHENAGVEVLSGACMFVRVRENELKRFDPDFFMYGEDIDLSFRIGRAGYKVKYLGEQTIIHFKGESTNKQSWSYYYWFYKTMGMFRRKHFQGFLNGISNAILVPFLWILMTMAFLKGRFSGQRKTVQVKSKSYSLLGAETRALKEILAKSLAGISKTQELGGELIIVNTAYENLSEIIAKTGEKREAQKVMFWNEEMGLLFGSFDKNMPGLRLS